MSELTEEECAELRARIKFDESGIGEACRDCLDTIEALRAVADINSADELVKAEREIDALRAEVERLRGRWENAANAKCDTFVVKVFGISRDDLEECGLSYSVSETLERQLCEACDKACQQWGLGAYGEEAADD